MKRLAALAMYIMASCTPSTAPEPTTRAATLAQPAGPVKSFRSMRGQPPQRSNADMAQDFLDLSFQLESGKEIRGMTRFEGPITVAVSGQVSELLLSDLNGLLVRLRNEAGLDIHYAAGTGASIMIEAVPQADLQRAVPRAACFVMPGISSWGEFLRARNSDRVDWAALTERRKAVIFLPSDAAPQEIRDCLHEELAQALGPLNDLYRLSDSVFNDDNVHSVLTGFDMLMLRAYYAPELSNGMPRNQAARVLPSLLARLNPQGNLIPSSQQFATTRDWATSIESAFTTNLTPDARRRAATQAIAIARTQDWSDVREGFSYYTYGRLEVSNDPIKAERAFLAADAIFRRTPETNIHAGHISVQLAAFALSRGDSSAVLRLADEALPIVQRHQNAALLATLMMFKAEALDMLGNSAAAEQLRLDSLGWARYGFGAEANVAARLDEIRSFRPF